MYEEEEMCVGQGRCNIKDAEIHECVQMSGISSHERHAQDQS